MRVNTTTNTLIHNRRTEHRRCLELHLPRKPYQQDRRHWGGHQIQDWKGSTCLCHPEAGLEQQEHPHQDQAEHLQLQCEVCFVIRFRDTEAHQSTSLETPSFCEHLRHILRIIWPDTISNEELWKRTQQRSIPEAIKERKWRWVGQTLRQDPTSITRQALDWNPQGKRMRCRQTMTWRRTLNTELRTSNGARPSTKRRTVGDGKL